MNTVYYTNVLGKISEKEEPTFPLISKKIQQSAEWSNNELANLNNMIDCNKFKKMDKLLQDQKETALKILKENEKKKRERKEQERRNAVRANVLELNWTKIQYDTLIKEKDENNKRRIIKRLTDKFSKGVESKSSGKMLLTQLTLDSRFAKTKSSMDDAPESVQHRCICATDKGFKESLCITESNRCVTLTGNESKEGKSTFRTGRNIVTKYNTSPGYALTMTQFTQGTRVNIEAKCEEVAHLTRSFPSQLTNNVVKTYDKLFQERKNPLNALHNPLHDIIPLRTESDALLPMSFSSRPGYTIHRNNERILQEGQYIKKINSNLAFKAKKVIQNRLKIPIEGLFEKCNDETFYCQKLNKQTKLVAAILEKSQKTAKIVKRGVDKYFWKNFFS